MLYLNHAGTSWPKAPGVAQAMTDAVNRPPSEWAPQFDADAIMKALADDIIEYGDMRWAMRKASIRLVASVSRLSASSQQAILVKLFDAARRRVQLRR